MRRCVPFTAATTAILLGCSSPPPELTLVRVAEVNLTMSTPPRDLLIDGERVSSTRRSSLGTWTINGTLTAVGFAQIALGVDLVESEWTGAHGCDCPTYTMFVFLDGDSQVVQSYVSGLMPPEFESLSATIAAVHGDLQNCDAAGLVAFPDADDCAP